MTRAEYINTYKDIAIRQMELSGIPASITLAQGCLESGDGNSSLAVNAKNHFGIKCHAWEGRKYYQDDDAKNECFRAYRSAEESFADHSDFLRYNRRYATLFDLNPDDYKGWAYGLKAAGYATNPQYPQLLIKIIEEYELYNYDKVTISGDVVLPPSPSQLQTPIRVLPTRESPLYKISLQREVFSQNGAAYIIAEENDTFARIAREYNLFTRELLSFNDCHKDRQLSKGDRVYIEKKRKYARKHLDKHVVEEGETLYSISQNYGIRLKSLRKINNFSNVNEPEAGSIIKLRK